jgi:hypothetical protein
MNFFYQNFINKQIKISSCESGAVTSVLIFCSNINDNLKILNG